MHVRAEDLGSLQRDSRETVEVHFAKFGKPGERGQTGIGNLQSVIEVHLLERFHAPEDFETLVTDLRQAGIVVLEGQTPDMPRRRIPGLPTIHAREAFEFWAGADVSKPLVIEINGRQLTQRRELRQGGQRRGGDVLASDSEAPQ